MKKWSLFWLILAFWAYFWESQRSPNDLQIEEVNSSPLSQNYTEAGPKDLKVEIRDLASTKIETKLLEKFRDEYMSYVPSHVAPRSSLSFSDTGPRHKQVYLNIDDVKVEFSDIRILNRGNQNWNMHSHKLPFIPKNLEEFPYIDRDQLRRVIFSWIQNEDYRLEKLEDLESTWMPSNNKLIPCANFQVDYWTPKKELKKENWCLNPKTSEISARRGRARN